MKNRIIQGALVGVIAAAAALLLHYAGFLAWLEAPLWNARARLLSKPSQQTPKIRIILVDQASLNWGHEENSWPWPWPRIVHSAVADFCRQGGAKSITFDFTFTENSKNEVDDDEALGAEIRKTPNLALACFAGRKQGLYSAWPEFARTPEYNTEGLGDFLKSPEADKVATTAADFAVPEISSNALHFGNVFTLPQRDAVIRRMAPFYIFDSKFLPSLGLASYLAANPDANLKIADDRISVDQLSIPVGKDGQAVLNFRGTSDKFPTVSAQGVINSWMQIRDGNKPQLDPSYFKDCYVFYGSSAAGLLDLKATPVGDLFPGVAIHATFLDNLLSGDFISDSSLPHVIGITLLFGILAGIIGRYSVTGLQLAAAYVILVPLAVAPSFAAYTLNIWQPASASMASCVLALVAVSIVNYALEGRQKAFIKNAFKQYLSPVVIDKLLQKPDTLTLGGETRELTIFFSDIQGFTSISESLSPQDLTSLLNDYLTAMTDIILDEGGTVDKYEGDAIIAFWNAPLSQKDHAARGVRASLRCQKKLAELRPGFRERVDRDVYARIGMNTGEVVVGNMGSKKRFDYTFLGDAGNLAARLEGINKQFNTYLMISEFTRNKLGNEFRFREVSKVRVVGKDIPVTVYEPWLVEEYEKEKDRLVQFEQGLHLYYQGDFSAALNVFDGLRNTDPTATAYIRKCNQLLTNPPDEWDGVWQMTEK